MANRNLMQVNGKDVNNESAYLTFSLADDKAEVRGFGQPITRRKSKEMAERYFKAIEEAQSLVQEVDANPAYADLKKHLGFAALQSLVHPSQTVSGVFGKELILQILSLRHCEGIRYIIGRDGDNNTIILAGVNESGTTTEADGSVKARSALIKSSNEQTDAGAAEDANVDPPDGEVHEEGTNIDETRKLLG